MSWVAKTLGDLSGPKKCSDDLDAFYCVKKILENIYMYIQLFSWKLFNGLFFNVYFILGGLFF